MSTAEDLVRRHLTREKELMYRLRLVGLDPWEAWQRFDPVPLVGRHVLLNTLQVVQIEEVALDYGLVITKNPDGSERTFSLGRWLQVTLAPQVLDGTPSPGAPT